MPTVNPPYFTYADITAFREYLAGTGFAAGWTADTSVVLRILEAASRTMEQYLGGRTWGPRTETRLFDLGIGALRDNALLPTDNGLLSPDYWPSRLSGVGVVPLDDWLLSATTVTAYADTARTSNATLTEGIAGDYLLVPYNTSPKHTLKLQENTAKSLAAGQQTLGILGSWGWQNVSTVKTTVGTTFFAGDTAFTATSGAALAVGQTVRIGSEQLYITAIVTNTVTVVRGVNGTTAATHGNGTDVAALEYPADVVQIALEIARNRWKERDAGIGQVIGGSAGEVGQFQMSRPGAEERALLRRLDVRYRAAKEQAGVYF